LGRGRTVRPRPPKKLLRDFSGFDSLVFCEDNEESSHGLD
jgi:hypothetical protein